MLGQLSVPQAVMKRERTEYGRLSQAMLVTISSIKQLIGANILLLA